MRIVASEALIIHCDDGAIEVRLALDDDWRLLDASPPGFDPVRHGELALEALERRLDESSTRVEALSLLIKACQTEWLPMVRSD